MNTIRGALTLFMFCVSLLWSTAAAAVGTWELPYQAGTSMLVTRGYQYQTHANRDAYALDFALGGCDGYGLSHVAIDDGTVTRVVRDGYGRGYGNYVTIDHGDGVSSLYAHLSHIPAGVHVGLVVSQDDVVGYEGNTGNVSGTACQAHPGTHLHFAMRRDDAALVPEPLSGYSEIATGTWYLRPAREEEAEEAPLVDQVNVFEEAKELDIVFTPPELRPTPTIPRIGAPTSTKPVIVIAAEPEIKEEDPAPQTEDPASDEPPPAHQGAPSGNSSQTSQDTVNDHPAPDDSSNNSETPTSTDDLLANDQSIDPPELVLRVEQVQFSTNTLHLTWQTSTLYDEPFEVDLQVTTSTASTTLWHQLIARATTTEYFYRADRGVPYRFRIRSHVATSTSDWVESSEIRLHESRQLVFSEVGWGGVSAVINTAADCTRHDWLELYNPTGTEVDLSAWSIQTETQTYELDGTVAAGGFYLVGNNRKGRDPFNSIPFGYTSDGFSLGVDGGSVWLVDSSGTIVDALIFPEAWPAGTLAGRESEYTRPMSRRDYTQSGSDPRNWETEYGIDPVAVNPVCGKVFGTPGRSNFSGWLLDAPLTYYSDLIASSTLLLENRFRPFIFSGPTMIPPSLSLVVEAGSILVGSSPGASIIVEGVLQLLGASDEPIRITSGRDQDTVPLPWFSQQSSTIPVPADWSHIEVHEGGELYGEYVDMEYGGYPYVISQDGLFHLDIGSHTIANFGGALYLSSATINQQAQDGTADTISQIYSTTSSVILDNVTFVSSTVPTTTIDLP